MPFRGAPPPATAQDIVVFRRFNRMYTRFIGTLNEGILDTEFSLAEARVLYEIATRPASKASEIAAELNMDPGYLSRLVRKFERAAWLKRKASREDTRSAGLTLTKRGKAIFQKLNALSEQQAATILKGLPQADCRQLIRSMRTIEGVLSKTGRSERPYTLRPHRVGDMGWVVHREGAAYAQAYGWDQTFEALVARIVADFLTNFDPRCERCWIVDAGGESLGHIFLVKHPNEPGTAKLRLLFVEPSARGMGLGHVLVGECVSFARKAGYRKIVLWTQSILAAAHRTYERAGFRLAKEEPHHSFGKDLIGQTWELILASDS